MQKLNILKYASKVASNSLSSLQLKKFYAFFENGTFKVLLVYSVVQLLQNLVFRFAYILFNSGLLMNGAFRLPPSLKFKKNQAGI